MAYMRIIFGVVLLSSILSGCSGPDEFADLKNDLEEIKRRPPGHVDPLPEFKPYKSFLYEAMTLRSPFEPPLPEQVQTVVGNTNVTPDENREKEFLEQFNLGQLKMVGTIKRDGQLWALINDGEGGIHRVKEGNYLGKNHGRIYSLSAAQLEIIEIVPNGGNGWVERPKVLQLVEKE